MRSCNKFVAVAVCGVGLPPLMRSARWLGYIGSIVQLEDSKSILRLNNICCRSSDADLKNAAWRGSGARRLVIHRYSELDNIRREDG